MSNRLTKQEFVERAKKIHGEKYDYSRAVYANMNTKTIIVCKRNNHPEFSITPKLHLDGRGCPICDKALNIGRKFVTKAKRIHNENGYDYSQVDFINGNKKVIIKCPRHGIFEQTPEAHLRGSRCPLCAKSNTHLKNANSPAILYYIKVECDGYIAYKIGITQRTTLDRFFSFGGPRATITLLMEERFSRGIDAFDKEQKILKEYASQKYTGPPLLSAGNTELFKTDILGLAPLGPVKTLNVVKNEKDEENKLARKRIEEEKWQNEKSTMFAFLALASIFIGLYLLIDFL